MSRPAGMGSGGDFRSPQSARGRARAHVRCQGSSLCSCRCLTAHLCPSVNHGSQSRCLKRSRPRPHWRRRQPHRLGHGLGQWRASAQAPRGAHAAASCRGSGKGRISGCAGHGQHKSARVSYTPRTAWATAAERTPNCRDGPDIAADGQKHHDDQQLRRHRLQQHRPDLLNRQTRSGSPRNPHLEPHMCATARAKHQQKQRETPKVTCHVHQCDSKHAPRFSL